MELPTLAPSAGEQQREYLLDILTTQLLDRVMPVPVITSGLLAAALGRRPLFAVGLLALLVVSNELLNRLNRTVLQRGQPIPEWVRPLRFWLSLVLCPSLYWAGGVEGNVWYVAAAPTLALPLLFRGQQWYRPVLLACAMGAVAVLMGVRWPVILGMVFALVVMALVQGTLTTALRRQAILAWEAAERSSQAAEAKASFLATMSHEIRTPLNGMNGLIALLRDAKLPEEERGWVENLERSAALLRSVVNDVLDYSKLDAGKMALDPKPCELAQLCRRMLQAVRATADEKGLELRLQVAADVPQWLELDAQRLQQVVLNLLTNGIKFTATGHVGLSARVHDGWLELAVEDTGMGISEAAQQRLFQPFEQADNSTSRRFGGTGLGLAISMRLVQLMGGTITLTSQLQAGSRFTVRVPYAACSAPQDTARSLVPAALGAHVRILVAEDNRVNQIVIRNLLKKRQLDFKVVENGAEVLESLAEGAFDLILMDCHMPVMDGYTACVTIRDSSGDAFNPRIPIVALTADASPEARSRCEAAGMDDFLSKPFDVQDLDRVLSHWLGGLAGGAERSNS